MLDARSWMLDVGCWMLDAGCWMLEVGCWMLDARSWKFGVWGLIPLTRFYLPYAKDFVFKKIPENTKLK